MGRSADCMRGACKPPAARSGAGSLARLSAGPSGDRNCWDLNGGHDGDVGFRLAPRLPRVLRPHLRLLARSSTAPWSCSAIFCTPSASAAAAPATLGLLAALLLARAAGGAAQRLVCIKKHDRSRRQRLPACGGAHASAAATAATAPGLVPTAQLLAVRCFGSMQRYSPLAHSSLKCAHIPPELLQVVTHAACTALGWRRWSMQGCCGRLCRHQPCRSRQHPPSCSSANSSWGRSDCTVRCTHTHCNDRSASMRRWHVNAGRKGVDSGRANAEGCARAQGTQLKGPATEAQGDDGCTLSDTQG